MDEIYKGSSQEVHTYLVKELGIKEETPSKGRSPGKYQLSPISQQIGSIYTSPDRTGKIYYTNEFNIEPERTKHIIEPSPIEGFTVESVMVQIIEETAIVKV
jgi:hypothetical protein